MPGQHPSRQDGQPGHDQLAVTCADGDRFRLTFSAIGTGWEVVTSQPLGQGVRDAVLAQVEGFDRVFSRFRDDSLITTMAKAPAGGQFTFPPEAVALFDLYDQLYWLTGGAVSPLVGRDLEMLGYDAGYTLQPLPAAVRAAERAHRPRWGADVHRQGAVLRTRRPVVLDVGAAGKGHLVDLVTATVQAAGVGDCLIDAGGDLRHVGTTPVRVGLEHPTSRGRVIGVVPVRGQALCASAVNRRAWGQGLHHVIDPRTGAPTDDVIATWVLTETALVADGLATALFFTPAPQLQPMWTFSWVQMLADHSVQASVDLQGQLFT